MIGADMLKESGINNTSLSPSAFRSHGKGLKSPESEYLFGRGLFISYKEGRRVLFPKLGPGFQRIY